MSALEKAGLVERVQRQRQWRRVGKVGVERQRALRRGRGRDRSVLCI